MITMETCNICPHMCQVNRKKGNLGRCQASDKVRIALYSTHDFEEPCISGKKGSGTVFFKIVIWIVCTAKIMKLVKKAKEKKLQ